MNEMMIIQNNSNENYFEIFQRPQDHLLLMCSHLCSEFQILFCAQSISRDSRIENKAKEIETEEFAGQLNDIITKWRNLLFLLLCHLNDMISKAKEGIYNLLLYLSRAFSVALHIFYSSFQTSHNPQTNKKKLWLWWFDTNLKLIEKFSLFFIL